MSQMISYAQNGEDVWIVENLPLPDSGFYVDIGCAHPFECSNTAFLRDRKWEGLAIDGNLVWAKEWDNIPAFHYAVISTKPEVYFLDDPEVPYYSRIDRAGRLKEAETIERLLERFEIGKFDFLSLDTEGTEFEILQSFDFEKHSPSIVVVEYNAQHIPIVQPHESPILHFMLDKGYGLVGVFEPVNMIFSK